MAASSYLSHEAALATAIARRKKYSPRVTKSALLALATENPSGVQGGDRDSEGPLQQRPSQGWGPASESDATDIQQYFDRAQAANQGFHGSAGQLAQAVQRSAYPGRYDEHSAWANSVLGRPGASQAPALSNVSRIASTQSGVPGASQDAPAQPSVFDVIARYRAATQARDTPITGAQSGLSSPYDPVASGQQIQDRVKQILALREPQAQPEAASPSLPGAMPSGTRGKIVISPTANKPGTHIQKPVLDFVSNLAGALGHTLTIGTGTNHSYLTVNGNVSEHGTGDAADVPMVGKTLIHAGQMALIQAGMSPSEARKQQGGLFNVETKAGRYQIIFNTHEGGDHTNHLHVGFRPRR